MLRDLLDNKPTLVQVMVSATRQQDITYSYVHQVPCYLLYGISSDNWLHGVVFQEGVIQWNLSVTTTSIIKFISCDLFSNWF